MSLSDYLHWNRPCVLHCTRDSLGKWVGRVSVCYNTHCACKGRCAQVSRISQTKKRKDISDYWIPAVTRVSHRYIKFARKPGPSTLPLDRGKLDCYYDGWISKRQVMQVGPEPRILEREDHTLFGIAQDAIGPRSTAPPMVRVAHGHLSLNR